MVGTMPSRGRGVDVACRSARLAVVGVGLLVASAAGADDPPPAPPGNTAALDAAAAKYDEGVAAQAREDYEAAAAAFAEADDLLPDPVALEAAIRAATLGDLAATAMQLTLRASRGPAPPSLDEAVGEARERFASRVGSLRIECTDCRARMGVSWIPVGEDRFALLGEHVVELEVRGIPESHRVDITPGAVVVLRPHALPIAEHRPAPRPERPDSSSRDASEGVSPAWFWGGAVLTLVGGGVTVWSGVDTLSKHDDFLEEPTPERSRDGQAAETRTYVLGAVTAGLGLATTVLGLFVVDWGSGPVVSVGASPSGVGGSVRGTL